MFKRWIVTGLALALAACGKPAAVDTCGTPKLVPTATPNSYASEREAAQFCVKRAAFALARSGRPLAGIADAAVGQCAAEEAAIGKSGTHLWDWERAKVREELAHIAERAAAQARSLGCGLGPNAARDTL